MEFRLLGPVEAVEDGRSAAIGGPKQRLVLAVLLLRRPEAVSSAALIDALWADRPPPTAAKTLQVFVARLRKALGDGVITTRSGGYAAQVAPESVDADRFERLLASGRAALSDGRPGDAVRDLRAALTLWRGDALADLVSEPVLQPYVQRLEGLRAEAVEERVEADLRLGRHAAVITELEALVAAEPLRERRYGQLMRALYGAGRQAGALAVFHRARRTLVEEVGVEPGPELRRLQERILAQDPALAPAEPPRAAPATRRRRRRAHAAIVLLAGAIGAAAIALGDEDRRPPAVKVAPDSVLVLDEGTGRVLDSVPVGSAPVAISAGEGAIWVASAGDQTLERIDPVTRRVTGRVGLGRIPSALAAGEGSIWVASAVGERGTVARVDPGAVALIGVSTVRSHRGTDDFAPHTPSALVAAHGGLWANRGRSELVRVPDRGADRTTLKLSPQHSADGLATGAGAIWLTSSADDRLLRIEPARGRITAAIPIAAQRGARRAGPYGVAFGHGAVWVANALADTVSRVDPELGAVTATVRVGRRPTRVAVGEGAVWVLNAGDGTVMRIDPASNAVTKRIAVPDATGVASAGGAVWVTTAGGAVSGAASSSAQAPRPLSAASCAPLLGAPGITPDVLIASDLPTWLGPRRAPVVRDMRRAIGLVLEDRGFRAGRHTIALQQCDNSRRSVGGSAPDRCAANARMFGGNQRLVGIVGPYHSSCATIGVPLLNAARGGPVAVVSPSNTYAGLTRAGPATAADEPDRFYPTRFRNYVRTVRPDDGQAAAIATFAQQRGIKRLFVLDDAQTTGYGLSRYLAADARAVGIRLVGVTSWPEDPRGVPRLVERVVAAAPDAVLLAGCSCAGGYEVLADLRASLPASTTFLGSDAMLASRSMFPRAHPAADGLFVTVAGTAVEAANAAGRRLLARLAGRRPLASIEPYVLQAAVATEVLLDAVARSDGSRASVVNELRSTRLATGIGAGLAFDEAGDPQRAEFGVYRLDRDVPGPVEREVAGMVFERAVTPARSLVEG